MAGAGVPDALSARQVAHGRSGRATRAGQLELRHQQRQAALAVIGRHIEGQLREKHGQRQVGHDLGPVLGQRNEGAPRGGSPVRQACLLRRKAQRRGTGGSGCGQRTHQARLLQRQRVHGMAVRALVKARGTLALAQRRAHVGGLQTFGIEGDEGVGVLSEPAGNDLGQRGVTRGLAQHRFRQLQVKGGGVARQAQVFFLRLALRGQFIGHAFHQQRARGAARQGKQEDHRDGGDACVAHQEPAGVRAGRNQNMSHPGRKARSAV